MSFFFAGLHFQKLKLEVPFEEIIFLEVIVSQFVYLRNITYFQESVVLSDQAFGCSFHFVNV